MNHLKYLFLLATFFTLQLCAEPSLELVTFVKQIEQSQNCTTFLQIITQSMNTLLSHQDDVTRNLVQETVDDFYHSVNNANASENFSSVAWPLYSKFLKVAFLLEDPSKKNNKSRLQFNEEGYVLGKLNDTTNNELLIALEQAPRILLLEEDHEPNYQYYPNLTPQCDFFNNRYSYIDVDDNLYNALVLVTEEIKKPVEEYTGTAWRVTNIRCWNSFPQKKENAFGGWHTDGFPIDSLKIMIYPRGLSEEQGTTELKLSNTVLNLFNTSFLPSGPAGTWMLFKNSEISHRATSPLDVAGAKDRVIVEITIAPTLKYEDPLVFAGLNSQYPFLPWYKLEDNQNRLPQKMRLAKLAIPK